MKREMPLLGITIGVLLGLCGIGLYLFWESSHDENGKDESVQIEIPNLEREPDIELKADSKSDSMSNSQQNDVVEIESIETKIPSEEPKEKPVEPVFRVETIDSETAAYIEGKSFKPNDNITIDDLRLLTLTYYDFDEKTEVGKMIVNKAVSEEVVEIFRALYDAKYPIEKINLVDDYGADDDASMADNNTSAFNYRPVSGTATLSLHSYGTAIDINPLQNPYVTKDGVSPEAGRAYLDRDIYKVGMVQKGDLCYQLFTEAGWTWGGEFKSLKDYQHFQKKLNQ